MFNEKINLGLHDEYFYFYFYFRRVFKCMYVKEKGPYIPF